MWACSMRFHIECCWSCLLISVHRNAGNPGISCTYIFVWFVAVHAVPWTDAHVVFFPFLQQFQSVLCISSHQTKTFGIVLFSVFILSHFHSISSDLAKTDRIIRSISYVVYLIICSILYVTKQLCILNTQQASGRITKIRKNTLKNIEKLNKMWILLFDTCHSPHIRVSLPYLYEKYSSKIQKTLPFIRVNQI